MSRLSLMESLATEARIGSRILLETWGGLRRSGWMNVVIIITMASILSIFGTLSAFLIETQLFVNNVGSGLQISVYAKNNADLPTLVKQIRQMNNVANVEIIPKEQAWEDMKKQYQVPDIKNPLPDTIHVRMNNQTHIEAAVQQLRSMPGVELVNYAQKVLVKIKSIARILSIVGIAVTLFLGTLTLFIISNTLHLVIQSRGREIEILRMMGVGNWYIRLPFLFQGGFYGLTGALIAYVPLSISEFYVRSLFEYFQFTTSGFGHSFVFLVMILIGVLVGAVGAAFSVHKYLKI